jgi:hypothetical protein
MSASVPVDENKPDKPGTAALFQGGRSSSHGLSTNHRQLVRYENERPEVYFKTQKNTLLKNN